MKGVGNVLLSGLRAFSRFFACCTGFADRFLCVFIPSGELYSFGKIVKKVVTFLQKPLGLFFNYYENIITAKSTLSVVKALHVCAASGQEGEKL